MTILCSIATGTIESAHDAWIHRPAAITRKEIKEIRAEAARQGRTIQVVSGGVYVSSVQAVTR